MSYSFSIKAATKAEAKDKVAAELDKVQQSQPVHAVDRQQAQAAAFAFIDTLQEDGGKDVAVSVNGSVGWSGDAAAGEITSASFGVSAYLVLKPGASA